MVVQRIEHKKDEPSLFGQTVITPTKIKEFKGINERQLWHYAAGVHKPHKTQLEKIQKGITALTNELSSVHLL